MMMMLMMPMMMMMMMMLMWRSMMKNVAALAIVAKRRGAAANQTWTRGTLRYVQCTSLSDKISTETQFTLLRRTALITRSFH
jgi:hypothetical protein